jgi:3-dehydroquinate synthase
MIGAFHQPDAVIIDTDVLRTLPSREFVSGLGEVIKYGAMCAPEFFDWLEQNMDAVLAREPAALIHAIGESCRYKAAIVARDERETGERALLNLGHTFAHAIETGMGYGAWLHGEAVATGMRLAADVSVARGDLSRDQRDRLVHLLVRAGLPIEPPALGASRYLDLMRHDKKVHAGELRFILLRALGEAYVAHDVRASDLEPMLP